MLSFNVPLILHVFFSIHLFFFPSFYPVLPVHLSPSVSLNYTLALSYSPSLSLSVSRSASLCLNCLFLHAPPCVSLFIPILFYLSIYFSLSISDCMSPFLRRSLSPLPLDSFPSYVSISGPVPSSLRFILSVSLVPFLFFLSLSPFFLCVCLRLTVSRSLSLSLSSTLFFS